MHQDNQGSDLKYNNDSKCERAPPKVYVKVHETII